MNINEQTTLDHKDDLRPMTVVGATSRWHQARGIELTGNNALLTAMFRQVL